MSIRAVFPPGETHVTVHGLYQWDFGCELEIHAQGLPAMVEVHFASSGVEEAEVRTCANVNGVFTVPIPDKYLSETAPITAWVYLLDSASGTTALTITLPIIARVRPKVAGAQPADFVTKYEEAIAGFNEHVESLKDGSVEVKYAQEAGYAEEAGKANNATFAESAGYATRDSVGNVITKTYLKATDTAVGAVADGNGKNIADTYLAKTDAESQYMKKVSLETRVIRYVRNTGDTTLDSYMPGSMEGLLGLGGTHSRDVLDRIRHVSATLYAHKDGVDFECRFSGVNYDVAEAQSFVGDSVYKKDFYLTMTKTDGVTQQVMGSGDTVPSFCIGDATMRVVLTEKGVLGFYFITAPTMVVPRFILTDDRGSANLFDGAIAFAPQLNPSITRVDQVVLCVDAV